MIEKQPPKEFDVNQELPISNWCDSALMFEGDEIKQIESITIKVNLKKEECHVVFNTKRLLGALHKDK